MKRLLTEEEIVYITDFLSEASELEANVKNTLRSQLTRTSIRPDKIPEFKDIIIKNYFASRITPGEMVGCIASTSIGETTTQASLSSFHQAGFAKANLTSGVDRLQELMAASKNMKTPSLIIYLDLPAEKKLDIKYIRDICHSRIEQVLMKDLIAKYEIRPSPELDTWYQVWACLFDSSFRECDWRLRLYLRKEKMWAHKLTLQKVCDKLRCVTKREVVLVHGPLESGIIDLWCSSERIPSPEDVLNPKVFSTHERKMVTEHIGEKNAEYFLKNVVLPSIKVFRVSGIRNVEKCYYSKEKGEYLIETKGGCMKDLYTVPQIDLRRSYSNNIWDIYELLGVEAAVLFMQREFSKIIGVSKRHLDVMIDWMTNNGSISSVSRYGIDICKVGPLAKASFEQPLDAFFEAAHIAQTEVITGVSAAISTGKLARIGTGSFDLILDTNIISSPTEPTGFDEPVHEDKAEQEDDFGFF
jgi:DNA-directed RNA polymerase II subunit RPB1